MTVTTSRKAVVTLPTDTQILITREFDSPKLFAVLHIEAGNDTRFEGHRTAATILCTSSRLRRCGRRSR